MVPLPCLARQESNTTNNGPDQILDYTFFIHIVSSLYCQYHGYRTDNQDKSHNTYKHQRSIHSFRSKWKTLKHFIWVRPSIRRKTNSTIRNQESTKCKGITHEEIPHHYLSILYVKGTLTSTPGFGGRCCCSCCHVKVKFRTQKYWLELKKGA